jgi:dTDP-4-amino-4,6-dideoxygalactose transaminase
MTGLISVAQPAFGRDAEELVLEVLRSGRLAQGPMVARLEALAAEMAGTTQAVAVTNGTAALELALELAGVGPGDEVVTSPLTFVATLNAILNRGATARFADVTADFTLDPAAVPELIGPLTRAILPVHLFGLPADLPVLERLAAERGLALVEDACQAHGAESDGRTAGSVGIGCFSLYATKNVAAGEGGLITTSDPDLARRARLLRNQGMEGHDRSPLVVGRNLRMSELHAAVAIPAVERLKATNDDRQANADTLIRRLAAIPGVESPVVPAGRRPVWHQFTVLLPAGCDRDGVRARLLEAGVETAVHYPRLVWDHPAYRGHPGVPGDDTPVARAIVDRWVSLPVHPGLEPADLERIVQALAAALA